MKLEAFIAANSTGAPETVKLYLRVIRQFTGWLGSRALSAETLVEYEAWLRSRYRPNSLYNKVCALNLYLKWRKTELRVRRPPREYVANPRLITPSEYAEIVGRITDPMERLVVRLLHDSLLRPSDVVSIRLADLDTSEGVTIVRMRTKKTGSVSESILTKETADELADYVRKSGVSDYLFPGDGGPHRNRTWPNQVLRKHHADGISPRTFRRTGATRWGDDITSLMAQGGWTDPQTVLKHYRKNVRARHLREFEAAVGPAKDEDPDDGLPGYG